MVPYRPTNIIIIHNNIIMIRICCSHGRSCVCITLRTYTSVFIILLCIELILEKYIWWSQGWNIIYIYHNIIIFGLFGRTSSTLPGGCPVNKYAYFRFIRWKRRRIRFARCVDGFFVQWLSNRKFEVPRSDSFAVV